MMASCSVQSSVTIGPNRTLPMQSNAAAQLHQTGHSCIVQHLDVASDGSADETDGCNEALPTFNSF